MPPQLNTNCLIRSINNKALKILYKVTYLKVEKA